MNDAFDVNAATRNQLIAKAHELGLDADNTISKEAVKDLVSKQMGQINVGLTPDQGVQVSEKQAELNKLKRVRIRIHESPEHPARIPVSVNGVMYTIKQGVWVDVPEAVVEVLRNAMGGVITQHEDERGKLVNVTRSKQQFPFETAHGA